MIVSRVVVLLNTTKCVFICDPPMLRPSGKYDHNLIALFYLGGGGKHSRFLDFNIRLLNRFKWVECIPLVLFTHDVMKCKKDQRYR